MLALLAAVTIAGASSPPAVNVNRFALLDIPRVCRMRPVQAGDPVSLLRPQDRIGPRRLGDLPPARAEYAVMRSIGGCMIPAPVGYHPAPVRPVDEPENRR